MTSPSSTLKAVKTIIYTIWFTFLHYSFDPEMHRAASLERVNSTEITPNAKNSTFIYSNSPDITTVLTRRKRQGNFAHICERYSISIKPKLHRSNSLSDLTAKSSEINLDFIRHTSKILLQNLNIPYDDGSCGDAAVNTCICDGHPGALMSWNIGKKTKKKQEQMANDRTYASQFANEFIQKEVEESPSPTSTDNSSVSTERNCGLQGTAAFPFKSTPSGNLKVQSNQVVFQSSTVGVLLADPTQAKVKVKFEGGGDPNNESEKNNPDLQLQYGHKENQHKENHHIKIKDNIVTTNAKTDRQKMRPNALVDEKEKDLNSLGYTLGEPIDWMRIQLPKKQDLFQEFYRRIHNYINTDMVVHIGDEEYHCHRMVLQVYSTFFDTNPHREVELPTSSVTPEAFQTIYEWMIFSGIESNKLLRRDNVLELFAAAQFLSIKDLEDQCWSFIVNENLFNEDTAFALYREARARGMTPVMDLMVPRIMRFFLPLVASKDFLSLEPEEVMTFLKSNYIYVTSEMEILMAGVRWLHGDWANRRRLAVDVMRCVRFGLISPWQLVDIKRNPDNSEILEIVSDPEVQQMVDDGLAYVIIKYWYGNSSKNYHHWIDVLGLTEPAERNWIGEEKNHVTYKDFLQYLEQFMVPRDQLYQQMSVNQPPRRSDDMPGSLRGSLDDRQKFDFPLPATLQGLPNMKDFFDAGRQGRDSSPPFPPSPTRSSHPDADHRRPPKLPDTKRVETPRQPNIEQAKKELMAMRHKNKPAEIQEIHMCTMDKFQMTGTSHEVPEKDSSEDMVTTNSDTSMDSVMERTQHAMRSEKRYSAAASYLAAATNALSRNQRESGVGMLEQPRPLTAHASASDSRPGEPSNINSPQISLFNQSKESLARVTMNKLSTSILGPSNKNYIAEGSLFNWDRETVLVFGGIDPHTSYGMGRNTGKDIYKFEPVTNVWEYVGDLPEPRHHHSVAFLRGRVYLVGGADPRDDDVRGKSVVVSTVWSYEPVSRSWYSENGLAVPRKNFGLVTHRMALYAIGGQDKKGRVLRSVERFDPKTGFWTEVRSMGVARMAVASVKYREYIWVAGGMTGEKKKPVCNIVECYNSRTNEWTEIHHLRFPRCFSTLFAMNDRLYIVGGAGKVSDKDKTASSVGAIDVWDWKEREWKIETEMSIPRHGHALAYLGTQIIIIGGVTTIYMRALSNVESFCCERGAWIRGVTQLPSPLSGHGAVTLPPASLM